MSKLFLQRNSDTGKSGYMKLSIPLGQLWNSYIHARRCPFEILINFKVCINYVCTCIVEYVFTLIYSKCDNSISEPSGCASRQDGKICQSPKKYWRLFVKEVSMISLNLLLGLNCCYCYLGIVRIIFHTGNLFSRIYRQAFSIKIA